MLSLNLAVAFTAAMLLSTAKSDVGRQAWSGSGSGGGDQGGSTCTNCTICPYSCRGQTQQPPPAVGPQAPPGYGWYAPPGTGTGIPGTGSGCPPGTAPTCCPQQQNPNYPYYSYYNSPPYSNVPYNGNELGKPFGFGGISAICVYCLIWGVLYFYLVIITN